MSPIAEDLKVADKNKINAFLPVRNKGNDFAWDTITGIVLADALGKSVGSYTLAEFQRDCQEQLGAALEPSSFWDVLERMYFTSDDLFRISPEFLIFKASDGADEGGRPNDRMAALFRVLLGGETIQAEFQEELNFLEAELLAVLRKKMRSGGRTGGTRAAVAEEPYLPYLAEAFRTDIAFLFRHPKYLLEELTNTLRLYAFCYCTQLALNVREWRGGAPQPKPLYFILDTEKASQERASKRYGYDAFRSSSAYLFPYLSASEALQGKDTKRPLWRLYEEARATGEQAGLVASLNNYAAAFAENRGLKRPAPADDLAGAFGRVLDLAYEQFMPRTHRHGINQKYMKELQDEICDEFLQFRGRSGLMLVLNQDRLLLLTNLAIGDRDRLRLHELLDEFKRRGVYFDNQSAQALVAFYERLGNVERMSDSGDAIYVRKTL